MFSGMMLSQYTAGALICENRILSHPASTGSISAAADQEDFVSMGMTSALKTQQIVAYETGVVKSVDPLGGSYLVERLTDDLEEQIWELLKVIEDRGGFVQCFLDRWVEDQITEKRHQLGDDFDSGHQPVVGVNLFRDERDSTEINIFRHSDEWQQQRIQEIIDFKRNRNQEPVQRALDALGVRAEEAAFLGDTPQLDVVGPMRIGMWSVQIGERSLDGAEPHARISRLSELFPALESLRLLRRRSGSEGPAPAGGDR